MLRRFAPLRVHVLTGGRVRHILVTVAGFVLGTAWTRKCGICRFQVEWFLAIVLVGPLADANRRDFIIDRQ